MPLEEGIAAALTLLGLADPAQNPTIGAGALSTSWQSPSAHSFTCLTWLIKGLSMAAHKPALHLAETTLSYLDHFPAADQSLQASQSPSSSSSQNPAATGSIEPSPASESRKSQQSAAAMTDAIQAAAATFESVPASQESVLSLSKDFSHVTVKPLWQQRFYTVTLQQLEKALLHPQSAARMGTDEQQPAEGSDKGQQGPLLLALAYLLKGTPAKLSKADLPRLVGLLLTALEVFQLPGQCEDKDVMLALLQSVQSVMKDPTGQCMVSMTCSMLLHHHAQWRCCCQLKADCHCDLHMLCEAHLDKYTWHDSCRSKTALQSSCEHLMQSVQGWRLRLEDWSQH